MSPWIIVAAVVVLALVMIGMSIKSLLIICPPSEVVIFSGPARRPDQRVGYRAIRGGRALRIPLLEQVELMDLTNIVVSVAVAGAYSRDGIPLNIEGVANIKIDGDPPGLDNAVERLLGKSKEEIVQLARETLEGNLRGVLAKLTPQEVNQDKEKFAAELIEEAEVDLHALGLSLDTLKIQTVSDEVGFLDAIGRVPSAQLIRDARKAEAQQQAQAAIQEAENLYLTQFAQLKAERGFADAEAAKRIVAAKTRCAAEIAREQSTIAAQVARAEAEIQVQTARIEQVRLQLDADVVAPAIAYKAKKQAEACAQVAAIKEDGEATARGMTHLAKTWTAADGDAREIFVMEKLRTLIGILVGTVDNVKIDQLTVVGDSANGGNTAGQVASLFEQLKSAGDVDLPALVKRLGIGAKAVSPSTTQPST
ncbi:MAG: flotillin family protein [Nannocystaceae bacterium]|nr:flotillin family protein [Nannocystaceae bacterium]